MRILSLAAAAALLFAAAPAVAQPAPVASVEASDLRARKELALRYMEAVGIKDMMMTMVRSMTTAVDFPNEPGISTATRDKRNAILTDAMENVLPAYMDHVAGVYARTFSSAELEALVAFYESDIGRSVTAKTNVIAAESNKLMDWLMPRYRDEVRRLVCERLGCEADSGVAPPRVS